MISRDYRNIYIDIIYKKKRTPLKYCTKMNNDKITSNLKSDAAQNKFICSICLNKRTLSVDKNAAINKRVSKSCPICQCDTLPVDCGDNDNSVHNFKTKYVQTSHTDATLGINLLNEVLSVFQSKRNIDTKTATLKDKSTNTDLTRRKPELGFSEIFHISIEDGSKLECEGIFTVLNYEPYQKVTNVISLCKHKSSSIPQMKVDELKHSLKEKTKSKDAIGEVHRMFATVGKYADENDSNRPVVRNGPRVLPVVKTNNTEECMEEYRMSSGDSRLHMKNNKTVIDKCCKSEKCTECVYLCCRYHRYRTGLCDNCLNSNFIQKHL